MTQISAELEMELGQFWHVLKVIAETVPTLKILCIFNRIVLENNITWPSVIFAEQISFGQIKSNCKIRYQTYMTSWKL